VSIRTALSQRESVQRAIDWVLSMQCKNGGWTSFDKDKRTHGFLSHTCPLDHRFHRSAPCPLGISGRLKGGLMCELLGTTRTIRGETGAAFIPQRAGSRTEAGLTLGRELHLRHTMQGCARPGGNGRGLETNPMVQQAAELDALGRMPMGLGGRDGGSYDDPTCGDKARARLRRRHGRLWDCLRWAIPAANAWLVAWRIFYARRVKTGRGMKSSIPELAFRVCLSEYHLYSEYFPLLALTTYSKVMAERVETSCQLSVISLQ